MPRRALVLVLLLAGCSAAQIPAADPSPSDEAPCRALVEALPRTLDGDEDTGRSEYAAAWGDPRIVLRCGVATPAGYQKTSEMVVVNEISWFAEEQSDGYVFTAVGRSPLVQVYVPDTHQTQVNPLVDLAPAMTQHTEVSGPAGAAP
ncbi:MAG: DUF3515 domain-containing protein [Micrococcales bacterium]|nr:DUF3515 domain-containing protein [Micrococcales bacterium]